MARNCACGGQLLEGFIPDFGTLATWVSVWLPGEPKFDKSVWDTFRTGGGVSTSTEAARMIEAYCCDRCGQLTMYALKPVPRGGSAA